MIKPSEIRELMQLRSWKQEALAAAIGVTQSTVSRWLSGQQKPSTEQYEVLRQLLEESGERTPRVVTGRMLFEKPGVKIKEYDLRAGASYGGGYALQHVNEDGEPTTNEEAVKAEWVIPPSFLRGELRLSTEMTDIIAIDGPSMVPDLMPGDRVLIDRSHRDPRQGGIFAVREDDGIIIKHVEVVRGSDPLRIVCKSSNPTYAPFELILDGENVAIIGRVAGRISRM